QVNALAVTPNKHVIAAAGYQHIRMYDLNSSNLNPIINYEGEDGKWMFTGGEDCSARIWDLRSNSFQCQRIFQVSAPVNSVFLHPNQAELIVGDQSGVIHLWDLRSDHNEQLNFENKTFSTFTKRAIAIRLIENDEKNFHIFDEACTVNKLPLAQTVREQYKNFFVNTLIPEPETSIQDIAINSDGTHMAAVNNKGHCFIWSLNGGIGDEPTKLSPRHKLNAHKGYALKCKFSPDSTILIVALVLTWCFLRYRVGKPMRDLISQQKAMMQLEMKRQLLVTTSSDETAKIWKTADFSEVQTLRHDVKRWVWDVAFTADSQFIFTGSSDGVARLWNIGTGTIKREYQGHQKVISALAFKDGNISF
ncbi:hypothetical protein TSAR_014683, partial [Trichomalopsis sarcophagae]